MTGTVSLNGKAFSGGVSIILARSGNAPASVPASVQIAHNQTSATFPVTVGSTNQSACSVISATYNQVRREVVLAVPTPPNPAFALFMTPNSSTSMTVRFPNTSNAPRALSVASSKPSVISVPAAVAVPAGALSANFPLNSGRTRASIGDVDCAVVTATDSAGNKNSVIMSVVQSIQGWSVTPFSRDLLEGQRVSPIVKPQLGK